MAAKRWTVGVHCAVLVVLIAFAVPIAADVALGARAWALETFIDITESDGRVVSVELRRPCGASVYAIAHAFCDEFTVPPPDCERLAAYLDDPASTNATRECLDPLEPVEPREKLGSFSLNVADRSTGNSKHVQIAIHEGDVETLDERMGYLCDKFKLIGTACPLLRRHLGAQIIELELANARNQIQIASGHDFSTRIERGVRAYERVVEHLLRDRHELRALVDNKASAYRRLQTDSKRESLDLRRRIRILESDAARRAHHPRVPRPPRSVDLSESSVWVHGERAKRIPRVRADNCSYNEYLRYARSSTPVIFTGFRDLPHSPGLPNWTFETLLSECGQAQVVLKKSVFGADSDKVSLASQHLWAGLEPAAESTLATFLDHLMVENSSELYLHDASIASFCPSLLDSFYVPRFFAEDRMQQIYSMYNGNVDFDDVGIQQRDYWPSLFIGGEATASSLHGDWGGTAAWMGLLHGRKHWIITSPSTRALLREEVPTSSSPVSGRFNADLMRKDTGETDDVQWTDVMREGELFEGMLEAGEVLFLPAECPHQVRNLEMTVAVAANFVDSANSHHFAAFLRQEMMSSSEDKHRALAKLLRELQELQAAHLPVGAKDLPYREYKDQQRRQPTQQPPLSHASMSDH